LTGAVDQHGGFGRAAAQESNRYRQHDRSHTYPLEFFTQISVSIGLRDVVVHLRL
jgi:hypothetical protein